MHRPKQFAQMESEAQRRRKTRSLRASLLKRGCLEKTSKMDWQAEPLRGMEREQAKWEKDRVLVKWQNGQSKVGEGEARVENWTTKWQREREAATTTPNLALYWKTKWLLNREKHWKLKIVCFVIFPFLCAFAFQPEHIKSLGCRKLIQCFLIISVNDLNTKKVRTNSK